MPTFSWKPPLALTPDVRALAVAALLALGTSSPETLAQAPSAQPDWFVDGNRIQGFFGAAVSGAGDVNGDGYSDALVGAPFYSNGQSNEGRAVLYLGSADGLRQSPSWAVEGGQEGALLGTAVSAVGDINGDGFDDVVVGAPGYDGVGQVLGFLGSAAGLSDNPAWVVTGEAEGALFGISVSGAGDVNGDGFGDIIVGAENFANGESGEGRATVYLGSAAGPATAASWIVEGNVAGARFGAAVAGAGDIDGDGYGDVLIGAPDLSSGKFSGGTASVYLGSAKGLLEDPGWIGDGGLAAASFGGAVGPAGDVNGDGFADIIVGASSRTNGEFNEGAAFVFLGSAAGIIDAEPEVWTVEGNQPTAFLGASVLTAGDVNGDGYADVVVGAPQFNNGELDEGQIQIYLGSENGLRDMPSWTAESDQSNSVFGTAVASAGDVNGDGFGDVIVGASGFQNGQVGEGRAFAFHGVPLGPLQTEAWSVVETLRDARLGGSVSWAGDINGDRFGDLIVGASSYDGGVNNQGRALLFSGTPDGPSEAHVWDAVGGFEGGVAANLGRSVAGAGDVNGDGFGDLIIGVPLFDSQAANDGRAQLYFGSAAGPSETPDWTADGANNLAQFGSAVAAAGDVNGDGYGDVIIGAPGFTNGEDGEGGAFVFHGSADGLAESADWQVEGNAEGARFGAAVASAGDINGDGFSDVIVGAPNLSGTFTEEGFAFVYFGSATGLSEAPVWTASGERLTALFGSAVASAGDVNGDGFADVIVGAPDLADPFEREGRAFVFTGSASGLARTADWTATGGRPIARFGKSVASAGDVNGDGFSDVVIGAPQFQNGITDEGLAVVYLGSPDGLESEPVWSIEGESSRARFGDSVASAGDVNGDGFSDIVIGASFFSEAQTRQGKALVYLGNAGGGPSGPLAQQRVGDDRLIAPLGRSDGTSTFRINASGRTAGGRVPVGLEWQVVPLGAPFEGAPIAASAPRDGGFPGRARSALPLEATVSGLDEIRQFCDNGATCSADADCAGIGSGVCNEERSVFYKWRVRTSSPATFFPRSPWMSVPGASFNETKLRTAAELPAPRFRAIGPAANQGIFADSEPELFVWDRGSATRFEVEWSPNPDFRVVVETSPLIDIQGVAGVQVYVPDAGLWRRVLRTAAGPDIREIPIFWRIRPLNGTAEANSLEVRALRLAAAEPVRITSPVDGAEFLADQSPCLIWDANHNERYRVVFAGNDFLGPPLATSGTEFDVVSPTPAAPSCPGGTDGFQWQVPDALWAQAVELARGQSDDGVYVVIFARDALDRRSFTRARFLRVIGDGTAKRLRQPQSGKR